MNPLTPRKINVNTAKAGVTIIFLNQLRSKVGVIYGNPEITTGGNALKFYASVRLDIRRKEIIKGGGPRPPLASIANSHTHSHSHPTCLLDYTERGALSPERDVRVFFFFFSRRMVNAEKQTSEGGCFFSF